MGAAPRLPEVHEREALLFTRGQQLQLQARAAAVVVVAVVVVVVEVVVVME